MGTRSRALFLWGFVVLGASCAGRYVRIEEKGVPCGEAQQIAVGTVQRLGYTIAEVTQAQPGTPGVVVGERQLGTRTARVLVQVFCTTLGAEIQAKAEGQGLENLDFAGQFEKTFAAVASARPTPRPMAESGVDVAVVLERPSANGLEVDLSSAGVLPARVRVVNRTQRRYRLHADGVVLQTFQGSRVQPLGLADVAQILPVEKREAATAKLLRDIVLQPGAEVDGYLLFPFGSYARARVTLEDLENEESEGFTIEF